jgi:hypothetical protein
MEWSTVKPDFKEECILVTAALVSGHWEFDAWIIEWANHGDGPYLAWLTGDGEEYGDLADLAADKYLILPKH